jgi:hypothetical protein
VAVHPDWQGRGIGRALLEAAVDYAEDCGGRWIVLQVRDSNRVARQLYESVGFKRVGEMVRLRKAKIEKQGRALQPTGLRPARWSEGNALSRLARTVTPHDVLWADVLTRELYETGPMSKLVAHLRGRRHQWWVQEKRQGRDGIGWSGAGLKAAVGIEVDRRNPWHRLRLLIAPQAQDELLAAKLIGFGLRQLAEVPPLPVEIEHPEGDKATQTALANDERRALADFEDGGRWKAFDRAGGKAAKRSEWGRAASGSGGGRGAGDGAGIASASG